MKIPYLIRKAKYEDIANIMGFIKEHWNKDHILANNRAFFEYEHFINNEVNFVIAEHPNTKKIFALCGFIQSCKNISDGIVWEVVWKRAPEGPKGVGVAVINFIQENIGTPYHFFIGLNINTIPIHEKRGFTLNKLKHYYMLNPFLEKLAIPIITNKKLQEYDNTHPHYNLKKVNDSGEIKRIVENIPIQIPKKDFWYINKRYFEHPIYNYIIFLIEALNGRTNSFIVTREIELNGNKILRIVDFIGIEEDLKCIGAALNTLMVKNSYEYIDFYLLGLNHSTLKSAGFILKEENDTNIIPNYFSPFLQTNIDIIIATPLSSGFLVFKGDADQDRPN